MKSDTITVRVVNEEELDADSADLTVVVEGSAVFSGAEAFKKAKELRALIDLLKEVGVDESRVKLRSVEINSQSFALIKTSSAKYVASIKTVTVELLPAVLNAVAAQKGTKLSRLKWNYSKLQETRSRLRRDALADALRQARSDAHVLGVTVLAIHDLTEETRGKDYNPEYISGDSTDFLAMRDRNAQQDIGFQLGNSTTVILDLRAEFRVGPIPDAEL
ncbi:MAG TPA: SIMPL domain-containing protein [Pirellulaceae bacterium]|nr:SIMPL domain-containing protein [Pirellulaceae bacterium]